MHVCKLGNGAALIRILMFTIWHLNLRLSASWHEGKKIQALWWMKHKSKLKNVFFFEGQQQSDIFMLPLQLTIFFLDPIRIATQKEKNVSKNMVNTTFRLHAGRKWSQKCRAAVGIFVWKSCEIFYRDLCRRSCCRSCDDLLLFHSYCCLYVLHWLPTSQTVWGLLPVIFSLQKIEMFDWWFLQKTFGGHGESYFGAYRGFGVTGLMEIKTDRYRYMV